MTMNATAPIRCMQCLDEFPRLGIRWINDQGDVGSARMEPRVEVTHGRLGKRKEEVHVPSMRTVADWMAAGYRPTCPTCEAIFPTEFLDRNTIVVGLVGQRGTGKTHYLWQLVLSLLNLDIPDLALDLATYVSEETAATPQWEEGLKLIEEGVAITATTWEDKGARVPVCIVVGSRHTGVEVNVLIYDVSGEQLQDSSKEVSENVRHLADCDLLLYFVTPQCLSDFSSRLAPNQREEGINSANTIAVLARVARLIRGSRSLYREPVKSVSAALVLSKADQLTSSSTFPSSALEAADYSQGLDAAVARIQHDSDLMTAFFNRYSPNIINNISRVFEKPVTCYALSATGCDAQGEGDDKRYDRVSPHRILEPILYMLWEKGIIADLSAAR